MSDYEKLKHDVVAHITAYGTISGVMAGDLLAALNATQAESVELAKRCLHAEDVAAKSREEALEEAARVIDDAAAEHLGYAEQAEDCGDERMRDRFIANSDGYKFRAQRIRALKSSRTDSSQPPATVSVESGRATEDDGATKSGAMISASPVAGKGNG